MKPGDLVTIEPYMPHTSNSEYAQKLGILICQDEFKYECLVGGEVEEMFKLYWDLKRLSNKPRN